jgi:antitoxin YefM
MQSLSLAYLRSHLDEALTLLDVGEVVITLDSGENVILMKEADLRALQETLHLLANPLNAERLQTSLQQMRAEFLVESKPA